MTDKNKSEISPLYLGLLTSQFIGPKGDIDASILRQKLWLKDSSSAKSIVQKMEKSSLYKINYKWTERSTKLIDYYIDPSIRLNLFTSAFSELCALRSKSQRHIRGWLDDTRKGVSVRSPEMIALVEYDYKIFIDKVPFLSGKRINRSEREVEAFSHFVEHNLVECGKQLKKDCEGWGKLESRQKDVTAEAIFACLTLRAPLSFDNEISKITELRDYFGPIIDRGQAIEEGPEELFSSQQQHQSLTSINESDQLDKDLKDALSNLSKADPESDALLIDADSNSLNKTPEVNQHTEDVIELISGPEETIEGIGDVPSKLCICVGDRAYANNAGQGLLTPLFFITEAGYIRALDQQFPHTGKIFVTQGFEEVTSNPGKLFRVEIKEATNYSSDVENNFQRWTTFNQTREWKALDHKDMALYSVIKGDYPKQNAAKLTLKTNVYPTNEFFLNCTNPNGARCLIGPLAAMVTDSSIMAEESGEGAFYTVAYGAPNRPYGGKWEVLNQSPHTTFEIELDNLPADLILNAPGNGGDYASYSELINAEGTFIDLSQPEHLLKWFNKMARKSSHPESQGVADKVKEVIKFFRKEDIHGDLPTTVAVQRLEKLSLLAETIPSREDFDEPLTNYLSTKSGKDHLKNILEDDLEHYLALYKPEAKQILNDQIVTEFDQVVEGYKREKGELEKEIRSLSLQRKGLDESLKPESMRLLETKRANLIEQINSGEEGVELQDQILKFRAQIDNLQYEINSRNSILEEIQEKTSQTVKQNRKDLISLKLDLDVLEGERSESARDDLHTKPAMYDLIRGDDNSTKRLDLLRTVHHRMEDRGLTINENLVAHLLITVCQNLIVTLSGKPGTGKTFSAACFAKALGIADAGKHVHIPVQRGWTADSDILGFYNNLVNQYSPDRYGLYDLIRRLQKSDEEDTFSLVTLDEANLSPVEYYFSSFMGCCDDKERFYTQGKKLFLPCGLRFLATINNDQTTEILSQRFLDRSPVINLDLQEDSRSFIGSEEIKNTEYKEFSFEDIQELFGPQLGDLSFFDNHEKRLLQTLHEDFDQLFSIQKRKIDAMSQFVNVLSQINQARQIPRKNAMDDTIIIFLFPQLKGQGSEYEKQLLGVKEVFEKIGYPRSAFAIERIINRHFHNSYDFFA